MRILFHRYTPWKQEIQGSTTIIAEKFIKHGDEVAYMYGLMHPGRLKQKDKLQSYKAGLRNENGAAVFTPFSLVPFTATGIFSKPWAADATYKLCVPPISKILSNKKPDVIWTVPPGSSALKAILPKAKLVMQVVDFYPAFLGEGIKEIEKRDYTRAHHIFSIGYSLTDYLVSELKIPKEKITTLGQGVNLNYYQSKENIEPQELKDLPHPRAIWVGVGSKADEGLFGRLANLLKEQNGSFIIIGPTASWMSNLSARFSNVALLGAKHPSQVPAYLQYCDVGVMLYDRKKQKVYHGQNPLKLYEYAAAGLKILSTPHIEYKYLNPPITIIEDESDIDSLSSTIFSKTYVDKVQLFEFIKEHSWDHIFEKARKIIETL